MRGLGIGGQAGDVPPHMPPAASTAAASSPASLQFLGRVYGVVFTVHVL